MEYKQIIQIACQSYVDVDTIGSDVNLVNNAKLIKILEYPKTRSPTYVVISIEFTHLFQLMEGLTKVLDELNGTFFNEHDNIEGFWFHSLINKFGEYETTELLPETGFN